MPSNRNIYTVQKINKYIKLMFDNDFSLRNIYIKGEISNCKYHYTGHIYFSLKDESGVISAVMFFSDASRLKFRLQDGMQVIVFGSVSVFERDGKYQIYVKSIEQDGQGDLYRQFEELKNRLQESGMFDPMYKKPIPRFSMHIGVVTAETGAVIRDIYKVASERNPYCSILLYPAKVQGQDAAASICEGIRTLDSKGLDVIIIGRGGGSIEDLWAFNEESVARAIFNANTPIISAVGHQTDFTIADFTADLRAATPTEAASLAVFDYKQFTADLNNFSTVLSNCMNTKLQRDRDKVKRYSLSLEVQSPQNMLIQKKQHLQDADKRLDALMEKKLTGTRERLIKLTERLEGMSPLKRLSEGYSFVSDKDNRAVKSVRQIKNSDIVNLSFSDGYAEAEILSVKPVKR